MPRKKSLRCTAHCSKCGQHFHSTAAFDAHRRGKFRPRPGERGRYCVAPEDAADLHGRDLFIALTERGTCNIYRPKSGVTIWTLRAAYGRIMSNAIWTAEDEEPTPEEIDPPRQRRVLEPGRRRKLRRLKDVR